MSTNKYVYQQYGFSLYKSLFAHVLYILYHKHAKCVKLIMIRLSGLETTKESSEKKRAWSDDTMDNESRFAREYIGF